MNDTVECLAQLIAHFDGTQGLAFELSNNARTSSATIFTDRPELFSQASIWVFFKTSALATKKYLDARSEIEVFPEEVEERILGVLVSEKCTRQLGPRYFSVLCPSVSSTSRQTANAASLQHTSDAKAIFEKTDNDSVQKLQNGGLRSLDSVTSRKIPASVYLLTHHTILRRRYLW